ncbi:MAG TPA: FecR domain-containing protein [Burkholderiaceae bacterium]|nr:FecR domain-containing protein [Burkholderiaceae bacterium]
MRKRLLLCMALGFALLATSVQAADEAGVVKVSKGSAFLQRAGQKLPATVGTKVYANDRILTGADGSVGITLRDLTLLSAGPNSMVDINKFSFDSTTHAGTIDAAVKRGTLSVVSGKIAKTSPENVRFTTPAATLGVRGTEFIIDAGAGAN